jgi:transposase
MENQALNVGIDFSQKRADFGLFGPQGELIHPHIAVRNSRSGYEQFRAQLTEVMKAYELDKVNISGEATANYWLPFFMTLSKDQELNEYDVHPYLVNPRWVKWYKKCYSPEHKTDEKDCFFIAERTRTMQRGHEWKLDERWMGLRFLTRYRFHLVQDLIREKNYYHSYLFVLNNAYVQHKPFRHLFGTTSREILTDLDQIDALNNLDKQELADQLQAMSGNRLKDPLGNAQRMKEVAAESFQIAPELADVLQNILNLVLDHIHFIENQISEVTKMMDEQSKAHPEVALLRSIPGIGVVFSCGIAAELGSVSRFMEGKKWDKKKQMYRPKNLRDADAAVAKMAGLWWPRNASGDFESQERKLMKTGNRYLRYYLIEAADHLRRWSPVYAAYYQKKFSESNKFSHKRALVLTARKSVRLYVGLLHRMEPFRSEEVYVKD